MSLGKFMTKYAEEFNIILGTLIPLVESSNIFNEQKQDLRQLLEDAKDRLRSMNSWLEKHGLEAADTPIVIRQSDIDAAVRRYVSEKMTNDERDLKAYIDQQMSKYRPVDSASGGASSLPNPSASALDHPIGSEGTESTSATGAAETEVTTENLHSEDITDAINDELDNTGSTRGFEDAHFEG